MAPPEPPSVDRVPAAASAPEAIASTQSSPALLVDESHVFWGDASGVWRASHNGDMPERLADGGNIGRLASDGSTLFFVDAAGVHAIFAPGDARLVWPGRVFDIFDDGQHLYVGGDAGLVRINADGSDVTTLTSEGVSALFVDDRYVYFYGYNQTVEKACK